MIHAWLLFLSIPCLLVALMAWLAIGLRKPQPAPPAPPPPFGTPDKPNRAWARMMFHNGLITIEELNAFYARHPE
jgi:hypothetical protein